MLEEINRVSFNGLSFEDYRDAYIALRKSLSALKRGKPTDWDLQVLGCSIDEFHIDNQYLVSHAFDVRERALFVKRLETLGCNLFDAWWIKNQLDTVREILAHEETPYFKAAEIILGNLLYTQNFLFCGDSSGH